MPKRTLDKILNELREENKVFYKVTRGRNGGMIIASVKTLFARVIQLSKEKRLDYSTRITEVFGLNESLVEETFRQLSTPWTLLKKWIFWSRYRLKNKRCKLPYTIYLWYFCRCCSLCLATCRWYTYNCVCSLMYHGGSCMSLKIMSIHILLMCLSLVVWDYLWKCSVSFMVLSRGLCLLGLPGKNSCFFADWVSSWVVLSFWGDYGSGIWLFVCVRAGVYWV